MPILAALPAIATIGSSVIGAVSSHNAANAQTQAANQAAQTQMQMYQQTRSDLSPYMTMGNSALSQLGQLFGLGGGGGAGAGGGAYTTPQGVKPWGTTDTALRQQWYQQHPGYTQYQTPDGVTQGSPTDRALQLQWEANYAAPHSAQGGAGGGVPDNNAMFSALQNFPGYQFGLNQGIQALDRSAASRGMVLSGAQTQAAQQFGQDYAMQQAWQPYVSQLNTLASLGENAGAQTGNNATAAGRGIADSQLAAGQSQAAGSVGVGNQLQGLLSNGLQLASMGGGSGGGGLGGLINAAGAFGAGGGGFQIPPF